jgi:hypothetical protein
MQNHEAAIKYLEELVDKIKMGRYNILGLTLDQFSDTQEIHYNTFPGSIAYLNRGTEMTMTLKFITTGLQPDADGTYGTTKHCSW